MIAHHPEGRPALLPALAAMTWLQALVALALFAPGAVAPTANLDVSRLSIFSTAVFAVGVLTSFWAGGLINRIGSLRMASLCAAAVAASMALAALGSSSALLVAGLCLGFAFGPETPASTALLGKLVTDERRALVFSVRQTGNQIGAVIGSLALPAIAIWLAPQWSYAAVGACAQGGGLLGRLGWGFIAMRVGAPRLILVGLGLGMTLCAATFGFSGDAMGKAGQYALAAAFGLTASGWNGVFLAEVARLAPQDRIGETTGAVLTASYAGLLVTPVLIAAVESFSDLAGAFVGLAILAFCGTIVLIWGDER